MTSITSSHNTPEPELTNNRIRNTIIEEGIIKSLHGIDKTYVERVETCCRSWKPNDGNQPPPNIEDYFKKQSEKQNETKRIIICKRFIFRFCRKKLLEDIRERQTEQNRVHTENGGKTRLSTLF